MAKKYLLWLDILGFEQYAEEIADYIHQIDSGRVRKFLIDLIQDRVEAIETKGEISGKFHSEDKWVLVAESLDLIFKIITEILDHNTGYEKYNKIPLEIAIGLGEFDEAARLEGPGLVNQSATIEFLKTYITNYYREMHRQTHRGKPVKSTFIIMTEPVYRELEPLDRKMCQKVVCREVEFFVGDLHKVQQRGKILDFLEKIKRPGSKLYDRIDDLYIYPLEYDEIKKDLETKRIVFIVGTPEYGKTYTALRLLWEYYNEGYRPIWITGEEEYERREVRRRLDDIEKELKPHSVIYFEDPFGKTRYEKRESLERGVGAIVECVKNVDDVYLVITSREEVFKTFEEEKLSSVELKDFERKLNIKKPSYDDWKRKEILLRWAESKDCKWLEDFSLKNFVVEQILNSRNLPSPLSIRDFVISTKSMTEKDRLLKKIVEKSKETARSFAVEIENMTEDKILFLLFPFIAAFRIHMVEEAYNELVRELKIEQPWEFNKVLNWFKDDKISIAEGRIVFSHSSYSDALRYLLVRNECATHLNKEIFCRVLSKLLESPRREAGDAVYRALAIHFDILPKDFRFELFLKLSEWGALNQPLTQLFLENLAKFSEDSRDKLFFKFSERVESSIIIAEFIVKNSDRLPDKTRELLLTLAEKTECADTIANTLRDNLGKLPCGFRNELLIRLSKQVGRWPASAAMVKLILEKFDMMPEEVRDALGRARFGEVSWFLSTMLWDGRDADIIEMISKARSKIDKRLALGALNELIKESNQEVRKEARELKKVIKEDKH